MNSLRGTIEITGDIVQLQAYVTTNKQLENKKDETGHLIFKQNNDALLAQIEQLKEQGKVTKQTIKATIQTNDIEFSLDDLMPVFFENFFAQLSFELVKPESTVDKQAVANYVETLFRPGFSIKTHMYIDYDDSKVYEEHIQEERLDFMNLQKLSDASMYDVLFRSGGYENTHRFKDHLRTNIETKMEQKIV